MSKLLYTQIQRKVFCIVCVLFFSVSSQIIIQAQTEDIEGKVFRLISNQNSLPSGPNREIVLTELQSLGPESFSYLGELAGMRDSFLNTQYKKWLPRLAKSIQGFLPAPEDKTRIRRTAMQAIAKLGPIAARECESAILEGLWDKDDLTQKYAIRAASWLMQTSPQAQETVVNRFKQHSQLPVQRMSSLDHIELMWSHSNANGLVLTNLLEDPFLGFEAALGLGFMSSKGIPAIPSLVQAHSSGNFHQRALIVEALGQMGHINQDVVTTILKSWNDESSMVRENAAIAVGMLGVDMLPFLPQLLESLEDSDNAAFGAKLKAIGSMGNGAVEAIPYLLKYCSPEFLKTMELNQEKNIVGQTIVDVSISAQMSLCRIDPVYCRQFVPKWPQRVIGRWWDPVQLLAELKQDSDLVVKAVEPLLEENVAFKQRVAAFVILSHQPEHVRANKILRDPLDSASMREQMVAASFLFKSKHETEHLEKLILECLQSEEKFVGQSAMNCVENLGEEGRPLLNTIAEVSWKHHDPSVRIAAGRYILEQGYK